jgi:hypothetical protein
MKYLLSTSITIIACVAIAGNVVGGEVIVPDNCRISGEAELIALDFSAREFALGDLSGSSNSGIGSWAHLTATTTSVLSPETVTCRLNGIALGNSRGTILDTSFTYILHVEDQPPQLRRITFDIEASRDAGSGPVDWEDGLLEDEVFLTVPSELPVVEGSAGNQWATLSFTLLEDGTAITCRYRGTGATPLEPSDSYMLDACTGAGRSIVAGEEFEVERIELHLDGGSPLGRTSVSLSATVGQILSDLYIFVVEDGSGIEVFRFDGWVDPDTGDFVVETLD